MVEVLMMVMMGDELAFVVVAIIHRMTVRVVE